MRRLAGAVLAALMTAGCATKGYVRTQVQAAADTSRMGWTAGDSAVRQELGQVRTDVDTLKSNVSSLRQELTVLRDSLGARIIAMEEGLKFIFPVTFAFDDATVREQDRPALDRFAGVVGKHFQGAVVTVEGFADPAGSASYNRRLSNERAENVVAYLNQAGLSGVTIRSVGLGETRQVVEGASRDMPGADANRRVVFVIEGINPAIMTTSMR
jgi:outer membrane protein OmpA-like peptidoglycan-associated protein